MYRAPRGTQDILPAQQPYWQLIRNTASSVCRRYGFQPIDVPIFEETSLFVRGVGEGTDIVEKEMYSFRDKGDTEISLRPEFTAGVVRAYVEHGMHTLPQPVKLFSIGPAFRYERPQAGRYRQLHQLNLEAIGEQDPLVDAEVMSVVWDFFHELGLHNLQYQLNSIGCPKCRPAFLDALTGYYRAHAGSLCEDCLRRLEHNPLRLLDCKSQGCGLLLAEAPRSADHLCPECADHFGKLRSYLEALGRPYTVNHRLVRGLDYYTKTVFEIWAEGIGAQNAICGGGRYDGLVEQLGGRPTPGLGVATGLERVILFMQQQGVEPSPPSVPIAYFAYFGDAAKVETLRLMQQGRSEGLHVECAFGDRSRKAQLKCADRAGARYAVIIGDDDLAKGTATVRSMAADGQEEVPLRTLVSWLRDHQG